jgi:hypothetical protein
MRKLMGKGESFNFCLYIIGKKVLIATETKTDVVKQTA